MSPFGRGLAELTRMNWERCSSSESVMKAVTQIGKLLDSRVPDGCAALLAVHDPAGLVLSGSVFHQGDREQCRGTRSRCVVRRAGGERDTLVEGDDQCVGDHGGFGLYVPADRCDVRKHLWPLVSLDARRRRRAGVRETVANEGSCFPSTAKLYRIRPVALADLEGGQAAACLGDVARIGLKDEPAGRSCGAPCGEFAVQALPEGVEVMKSAPLVALRSAEDGHVDSSLFAYSARA